MAETPVTIKLGNQTFIRTTDMIIKTLTKDTINNDVRTLIDSDDAAAYQVPTGKIFRALFVSMTQDTFGVGQIARLRDSTTVNTANGSVKGTFTSPVNVYYDTPVNIDFAADRFVTCQALLANIWMKCIGIEMDV